MIADVDTFAIDELDRVLGAENIRSPRREYVGGEWDYLNSIPLALKRRLIGGRYLTSTGLMPDVAADIIERHVPDVHGCDEAMAWYIATCRTAIDQTRRLAEQRRYRARVARAAEAGQDSYHYHRLARTAGLG